MGKTKKTIPWEEINDQIWTDEAFRLMQNGDLTARVSQPGGVATLIVHGRCPRCGCTYDSSRPLEAVTTKSGRLGEQDLTGEVGLHAEATLCECKTVHSGRPEGGTGCGVCFTVLASVDS